MLWTMLNAICFLVCILGSVGAARHAKTGLLGYALAVAIGLALGGSFTWTMWTVGKGVAAAIQAYREARQKLYSGVLLLAVALWILIALFVADRLTSAAMRLAGPGGQTGCSLTFSHPPKPFSAPNSRSTLIFDHSL